MRLIILLLAVLAVVFLLALAPRLAGGRRRSGQEQVGVTSTRTRPAPDDGGEPTPGSRADRERHGKP